MMKPQAVIFILLISPFFLFAQKDTVQSKKNEKNSVDSSKRNFPLIRVLPPRELIIKMKDLKEIKNLARSSFKVIDDTSRYTSEEVASGLSEEELDNYKKNKDEIKQLLIQSPSEEQKYPALSTIRKILGIAKTAAVIIILILSL